LTGSVAMAATTPCDNGEVLRIAEDLAAKYGVEAVAYAKGRAERAREIGDELALGIWEKVLAAITALSTHPF